MRFSIQKCPNKEKVAHNKVFFSENMMNFHVQSGRRYQKPYLDVFTLRCVSVDFYSFTRFLSFEGFCFRFEVVNVFTQHSRRTLS